MHEQHEIGFRPEDTDRFLIEGQIEEGLFERNFRAYDQKLAREVLIKVPARQEWEGWSVSVRDRIAREARVMARVQSEHVARVFDVLETGSGPAIVMEVPHGEPISERLSHGTLSPAETRRLGIAVANALAAMHHAGIVYRSLGPQSVLTTAEGKVLLADFTFAKMFAGHGQSSMDHRTPYRAELHVVLPYPAPELIAGKQAEPRSDIFACGALLFRCLCGEDPFADPGQTEPRIKLRKVRPDVPPELAEIIRRCLAPNPMARFNTGQSLAESLVACPDQVQLSRRKWLTGVATSAVIAGGAGYWLLRGDTNPAQEPLHHGYDTRRALLIGIDQYQDPKWPALTNALNDIDAVAELLTSLGWQGSHIRKLRGPDATKRQVQGALSELNAACRCNDAVLVYFAGHGLGSDGGETPVAVPYDAAREDRRQSLRELDFAVLSDPKHVLFVFDSCNAGSMNGILGGRDLGRGRDPGASRPQDSAAKFYLSAWRGVLSSAAATEEARDGTAGNSPFCRALLAALDPAGELFNRGKGVVLASQLGAHLKSVFKDEPQSPSLYAPCPEPADFVFTRAR